MEHVLAQVGPALDALGAAPAFPVGQDGDAPAHEAGKGRAPRLHHPAAELVPEDDIRGIGDVPAEGVQRPGVLPHEVADVAPADAAAFHLDENLVRRGRRHRDILHHDVVRALQNGCSHVVSASATACRLPFR